MRAVLVVLVGAMVGCGSELPSYRDLYGTWLETSDGVHRSYEFAATSDARPEIARDVLVYLFRRYPVGQAPVLVECGVYDVVPSDSDATDLVITVLGDETGERDGGAFRIGLDDWDGDHVTLRDPRYGAVRYTRVDRLP